MAKRIPYENLILNLYLIDRIRARGNMFVVKMFYLYEDILFQKEMIGPLYKMHRDNYGPFNKEVCQDLKALAKNGFLRQDLIYYDEYDAFYNLYSANKVTRLFLNDIQELLDENRIILDYFDNLVAHFIDYNGKALKKHVYSLKKTGMKQKRMRDYKMKEIIIDPLETRSPALKFELDDDWYDTIEILLDPELRAEFQNAINDVRTGNVIFHDRDLNAS